jgi:hypothetical protein
VPHDRDLEAPAFRRPTCRRATRSFLSLALGWAEVVGAHDIVIGVNALDYSGYPDCRPEFIAAFERLADLATRAGVEGGRFRVHTPLIALGKADIIRRGLELGLDYGLTHSCYDPAPTDGPADVRQLRAARQGFREAASPTRAPGLESRDSVRILKASPSGVRSWRSRRAARAVCDRRAWTANLTRIEHVERAARAGGSVASTAGAYLDQYLTGSIRWRRAWHGIRRSSTWTAARRIAVRRRAARPAAAPEHRPHRHRRRHQRQRPSPSPRPRKVVMLDRVKRS